MTAMRRPLSSAGHFESDSVTGRTTKRSGSMKNPQIKQLIKNSKRQTSVTRVRFIHFGAFPHFIGPGERRTSCMRKNSRPRKTEIKIKKLIVISDQDGKYSRQRLSTR